jgi:hypothetical protein
MKEERMVGRVDDHAKQSISYFHLLSLSSWGWLGRLAGWLGPKAFRRGLMVAV